MSGRYTKGGTGREWRRGVYRIEALPMLGPAVGINPRESWGRCTGTYPRGNTVLDVILIRGGVAGLARCQHCGGRSEVVIPAALLDLDSVHRLLHVPLDAWNAQHGRCHQQAIAWQTPALVEEFVSAFLKAARQDLARGIFVWPCVHLLATDGRAYGFFPPALAERGDDPVVVTEEFRASLRAFIRQRRLDLLAAVVTGESWMTDLRDPDSPRQEAISIYYATTDFEKAIHYGIRRHHAGSTSGPGELLREVAGQGTTGAARLVATLLA